MHPYSQLPDRNFWKRFVSDTPWRNLKLNDQPKFQLTPDLKVATAGSCFAQHICRYLKKAGIDPYIAEAAHPLLLTYGGAIDSFGQFSARYGNIYTVRQCLELVRQATGEMPVIEDFVEHDGHWFDLLRPNIEKVGFATRYEAHADRTYHLERVKHMLMETDVFVFTIGLTESWYHSGKGHTYPVCPGTVRGTYDPDVHCFHNAGFNEIRTELESVIEILTEANPSIKIIFTVSPVPLVATNSEWNVVVASTYSKSILRAVVGEVERNHSHVAYFPSYEIISSPASFGQYLASDLREVTERGVTHVMEYFLDSFYGPSLSIASALAVSPRSPQIVQHNGIDTLPECEELSNNVT